MLSISVFKLLSPFWAVLYEEESNKMRLSPGTHQLVDECNSLID